MREINNQMDFNDKCDSFLFFASRHGAGREPDSRPLRGPLQGGTTYGPGPQAQSASRRRRVNESIPVHPAIA